jgi:hypothetical protein
MLREQMWQMSRKRAHHVHALVSVMHDPYLALGQHEAHRRGALGDDQRMGAIEEDAQAVDSSRVGGD